MVTFRVFACTGPRSVYAACPDPLGEPRSAKLQPGRSSDLSLPARAHSLSRLQNPTCIQSLTPSTQQRAVPNSFLFNRFQTLFPPHHTTALSNPFGIKWFRTLSSRHNPTALNNPFEIKQFRTLSRYNGDIRDFTKKFLNNHLNFPCPPWRGPEKVCESRLPRASRGVRSGRAFLNRYLFSFQTLLPCLPAEAGLPRASAKGAGARGAQKQGGGGTTAYKYDLHRRRVEPTSYGIRKILCSFNVRLLHSFWSSFKPPLPHRARKGSKHSSRDCSALWGYKSASRNCS